jgi:hypothetical protein
MPKVECEISRSIALACVMGVPPVPGGMAQ